MVIGLSVGQRERIKHVMLVVLLMEYHNNICERTYLLRAAIVHPSLSPWRYLYDNDDDTSFLHLTGVSRKASNILWDILFPPEPTDKFGRQPRGHPKILDNMGMVGLLLFYIGSTMTYKLICLIFGILPTQCSTYIAKMVRLAAKKLRHHPLSWVNFPDNIRSSTMSLTALLFC